MSTYAHYHVWVGIRLSNIQSVDNRTIDEILRKVDPVEINGLPFTAFGMHGERVGVGVELLDFEWETAETGPTEFDTSLYERVFKIIPQVSKALRSIGISIDPKVYHHIDLGG